jgi:hypothetical protein
MTNILSDVYTKTKGWLTDVKDLFGGTTIEEIEIQTTTSIYNPILYKKISSSNVIYYILKTEASGMVIYNKLTEDNIKNLLFDLNKSLGN